MLRKLASVIPVDVASDTFSFGTMIQLTHVFLPRRNGFMVQVERRFHAENDIEYINLKIKYIFYTLSIIYAIIEGARLRALPFIKINILFVSIDPHVNVLLTSLDVNE